MERAGVYTTEAKRRSFEEMLGGRWMLDVRTEADCGLLDALGSWTAAGIAVAVIDDCALAGPPDEAALLEWAAFATSAAPRPVMVFDGTRDVEDAFLYQLVSTAGVLDLVVTSVGDTLAETLPARVERPAKLMDVAHWKTADKRKLKRRDAKGRAPFLSRWRKRDRNGEGVSAAATEMLEGDGRDGKTSEGGFGVGEMGEERSNQEGRPVQVSAASLMVSRPSFGAAMRREDGEAPLASPTARAIVAVGAASRGIGCTHLSCALALELDGKGVETCCAVYSPATFDAMRRALAPNAKRSDEFPFGGVTFYAWNAQRPHAGEYDCVVCDCGLVDYPDDDPNSPASLFRRAGYQALLVSGAPWLLEESSAAIAARDRDAVAGVSWFTVGADPLVATNIASAIAQASGRPRAEVHPVPYRPGLMCGDASRYEDYASLLDPLVDSARSFKVEPEEFARRGQKRRGLSQ